MQGYIYQMFSTAFPQLHDDGYQQGKRKFRHFTFSRLYSKGMKRQSDKLTFFNPLTFSMSFLIDPMPNIVIKHLIRNRTMRLANEEFIIKEANAFSEPFTGEEKEVEFEFQTLSPIVAHRDIEKNGRPFRYYFSPFEPEFFELIRENLKRKYESIYNEQPPDEMDCFIVPTNVDPKRSFSLVKYRNFVIKGYSGRFHFKGSGKLAQIAFHTGFGSNNPQGFGMADYFDCKVL